MTADRNAQMSALIDRWRSELTENLCRLVRIPSVQQPPQPGKPFGEPVDRALQFVLDIATQSGFSATSLDGYFGYAEYGDGAELVGALGHVDVVPEGDRSDWSTDPFAGVVLDGRVIGRGATDDKGPVLSVLYGLRAVAMLGDPPKRRFRLMLGTNEESGWGGIAHYLAHDETPTCGFAPDGMFTVANREKGIVASRLSLPNPYPRGDGPFVLIDISGGKNMNSVPDSAQAIVCLDPSAARRLPATLDSVQTTYPWAQIGISQSDGETRIHSAGHTAHAMTPSTGRNAIHPLLELLIRLDPETGERSPLAQLARRIAPETDGRGLGMRWSDATSGELTVNLGTLRTVGSTLEASLDIRSPVSRSCSDVERGLQEAFAGTDVTVKTLRTMEPLYVPDDHPLVQTLCHAYESVTGKPSVLHAIGGGSYARAFQPCVSFGAVHPGAEIPIHRADEYITIEDLTRNAKIYAAAIDRLVR